MSLIEPGLVMICPSVVSEARAGKAQARARCVCALSIQRLEGSRPRLRRTRALCKFNRRTGAVWRCAETVPQRAIQGRMRE